MSQTGGSSASVTQSHVLGRTIARAVGFGAVSASIGLALASPALAAGGAPGASGASGEYAPPPPPPGTHVGVGHVAFTCTFDGATLRRFHRGRHHFGRLSSTSVCQGRVDSYTLQVTPTGSVTTPTQLPVLQQFGAHDPGHKVLVAFDLTFVQNGHQVTGFPATITISGFFAPGDSVVEFGPSGWTPVSATISGGQAVFTTTGSGIFAVVGPLGDDGGSRGGGNGGAFAFRR